MKIYSTVLDIDRIEVRTKNGILEKTIRFLYFDSRKRIRYNKTCVTITEKMDDNTERRYKIPDINHNIIIYYDNGIKKVIKG